MEKVGTEEKVDTERDYLSKKESFKKQIKEIRKEMLRGILATLNYMPIEWVKSSIRINDLANVLREKFQHDFAKYSLIEKETFLRKTENYINVQLNPHFQLSDGEILSEQEIVSIAGEQHINDTYLLGELSQLLSYMKKAINNERKKIKAERKSTEKLQQDRLKNHIQLLSRREQGKLVQKIREYVDCIHTGHEEEPENALVTYMREIGMSDEIIAYATGTYIFELQKIINNSIRQYPTHATVFRTKSFKQFKEGFNKGSLSQQKQLKDALQTIQSKFEKGEKYIETQTLIGILQHLFPLLADKDRRQMAEDISSPGNIENILDLIDFMIKD